jgi:hypothetical protein
VVSVVLFVLFWFYFPACMQSFDMIQRVRRVRGMHHSGDYEKVIPAGWLPSILERMLPLFQVRQDKAGTALSLLSPISSCPRTQGYKCKFVGCQSATSKNQFGIPQRCVIFLVGPFL